MDPHQLLLQPLSNHLIAHIHAPLLIVYSDQSPPSEIAYNIVLSPEASVVGLPRSVVSHFERELANDCCRDLISLCECELHRC